MKELFNWKDQEWPINFVSFATNGKCRLMNTTDVPDKAITYTDMILTDALSDVLTPGSLKELLSVFKDKNKELTFEFHEFLSHIIRGAIGTPDERLQYAGEEPEAVSLYDKLRLALIQAAIALNPTSELGLLQWIEKYPELALNTEKLHETLEYIRRVIYEETKHDHLEHLRMLKMAPECKHNELAGDDKMLAVAIESFRSVYERYEDTPLFDLYATRYDILRYFETKNLSDETLKNLCVERSRNYISSKIGRPTYINCDFEPDSGITAIINILIELDDDEINADGTFQIPHEMVELCGNNTFHMKRPNGTHILTGKIILKK